MIDFKILSELIGQNIILKLPKKNNTVAQQIFETITINRENFKKWMPWIQKIQTFEDCIRFLTYMELETEQKEKLQYLIFDKDTNQFYGLVSFYDYAPLHKRGEIGIWIDQRYQRRHIASNAIQVLEKYLFSNNIHRIEAHCEQNNEASICLLKKIGYKEIALLKDYRYSTYDKKFCDTLYLYKLSEKTLDNP